MKKRHPIRLVEGDPNLVDKNEILYKEEGGKVTLYKINSSGNLVSITPPILNIVAVDNLFETALYRYLGNDILEYLYSTFQSPIEYQKNIYKTEVRCSINLDQYKEITAKIFALLEQDTGILEKDFKNGFLVSDTKGFADDMAMISGIAGGIDTEGNIVLCLSNFAYLILSENHATYRLYTPPAFGYMGMPIPLNYSSHVTSEEINTTIWDLLGEVFNKTEEEWQSLIGRDELIANNVDPDVYQRILGLMQLSEESSDGTLNFANLQTLNNGEITAIYRISGDMNAGEFYWRARYVIGGSEGPSLKAFYFDLGAGWSDGMKTNAVSLTYNIIKG